MSTVDQIPCELCGVLIFTRTSVAPDWDGCCDCLECGGRHAVCACALKWDLFRLPAKANSFNQTLVVCPDNVIVVRELMRPERPPALPFAPASFDKLQQQLAKTIRNSFVSTTKDLTSVVEVFRDVARATGVTTEEFVSVLGAVREAAHAEGLE